MKNFLTYNAPAPAAEESLYIRRLLPFANDPLFVNGNNSGIRKYYVEDSRSLKYVYLFAKAKEKEGGGFDEIPIKTAVKDEIASVKGIVNFKEICL